MRLSFRVLLAALGVLLVGAVAVGSAVYVMDEPATAANPTPSLYTNLNSTDLWAHPAEHLGARVAVTGEVLEARPIAGGAILAVRVDGRLAAVHVFDAGFRADVGQQLRVVGTVRGPLGDTRLVPGVPASAALPPGTTVVDAAAVTVTSV